LKDLLIEANQIVQVYFTKIDGTRCRNVI